MTMRIENILWRAIRPVAGLLPLLAVAIGLATGPSTPAGAVIMNFNWDWDIVIRPVSNQQGQPPDIPITLWGQATLDFQLPSGFNPGTPDNPIPVPPGPAPTPIPIEIVSLSLTGSDPTLGNVELRLGGPSSIRLENLENVGGFLQVDSFFDIFVELEFDDPSDPSQRMVIGTPSGSPIQFMNQFGPQDLIPALDFFWLPTWFWAEFPVNTQQLVDATGAQWDSIIELHAHVTPEPAAAALFGFGLIGLFWARRRMRKA